MNFFPSLAYFLFFGCMTFANTLSQKATSSWKDCVFNKETTWYASGEAELIAKNVLLYQRENGGWPKNIRPQIAISKEGRKAIMLEKANISTSTIDNGATYLEMLFLSKVYGQTKKGGYQKAFLKGLEFLLEAQYPNGGWPQYYPVPSQGYYKHVTFNDDAMVNVMRLLKGVSEGSFDHLGLPRETVLASQKAFERGLECILATQYHQKGKLTGWCAQYDSGTLLPAKARSYELPSLSGKESAQITLLLMEVDHPSQEVIVSVTSAITWFRNVQLEHLKEVRDYSESGKLLDKKMIRDTTASPLWARFMELEDNTPFFSDRDGIKKGSLDQIGPERRNGYAWYTNEPQKVLDRYPEWKAKHNIGTQTKDIVPQDEYHMVVAQDGSGDYSSIQEAINSSKSFPDKRVIINIKNGTYREKVHVYSWNPMISLIGEDKEKTVITYDDYFDKIGLGRNSTFHTATVLVEGNDFYAKDLTIRNTAGNVGQAVALSVHADRVLVENSNILGNQDTLYVSGEGFVQYFKNCYIEGTTDFIFGEATALFQKCTLFSKSDSFITAASTPKGEAFGLVFLDCTLSAVEGTTKVFLGRPWRTYAKIVFMNCYMGDHILPIGWDNWSNPEAEKNTLYAEYNCKGPGYRPKDRAAWARQLTPSEAEGYNVEKILGSEKIPPANQWYAKFQL